MIIIIDVNGIVKIISVLVFYLLFIFIPISDVPNVKYDVKNKFIYKAYRYCISNLQFL